MKYIFLLALIVTASFFISFHGGSRLNLPTSNSSSLKKTNQATPTSSVSANFTQTGVLIKDSPGFKPGVWYLSFDLPGNPGQTAQLNFPSDLDITPLSVGSRVLVTGQTQPDQTILVSTIAPDETSVDTTTNSHLIDWTMAQDFLKECSITQVFQSHSLKVTLHHKDGRVLTSTEPQIDDVINLAQSLKNTCGDIRIATE